MSLFEEGKAAEVVKPADIIEQAGITPEDMKLDQKNMPDKALEDMVKIWIEQIASHISVRLGYTIQEDATEKKAIEGILTGNVMNMITYTLQQRTSPIIQLGDYAVDIIEASRVIENLDDELKPFYKPSKGKSKVRVFLSSNELNE